MRLQSTPSTTEAKRNSLHEPVKPISVTITDACRLSGLGRTLIYELIGAGKLQTSTVGRRRLVMYGSLEELIVSSVP